MPRNEDFAPGAVILFALVAVVGGFSALKLIGPSSPTANAAETGGGVNPDLLVYPLVIGLPAAGVIVLFGWWFYG